LPGKTVQQKTGDWYAAYLAIREELTPQPVRDALATMKTEPTLEGLGSVERLARLVAANDRAAALAAAIITAAGVRPGATVQIEDEEDAE